MVRLKVDDEKVFCRTVIRWGNGAGVRLLKRLIGKEVYIVIKR